MSIQTILLFEAVGNLAGLVGSVVALLALAFWGVLRLLKKEDTFRLLRLNVIRVFWIGVLGIAVWGAIQIAITADAIIEPKWVPDDSEE